VYDTLPTLIQQERYQEKCIISDCNPAKLPSDIIHTLTMNTS